MELKAIIKENTWLPRREEMDFGWGNGYVLLPKEHPFYGKNYMDIDVDVHGGLTYSGEVSSNMIDKWDGLLEPEDLGKWMVGFDTCHLYDTLDKWPKYMVQAETDNLLEQLKQAA